MRRKHTATDAAVTTMNTTTNVGVVIPTNTVTNVPAAIITKERISSDWCTLILIGKPV